MQVNDRQFLISRNILADLKRLKGKYTGASQIFIGSDFSHNYLHTPI